MARQGTIYTFDVDQNVIFPGTVKATSFIGNATTATAFSSERTIALTGDITGSVNGTGSSGWSVATTIGTGKVTNSMLAGSIANDKLINSSITIAGNTINLGGTLTVDTLNTSLGSKTLQTAVSDPSASGNSSTFIKTISQNANGVITATKATIANHVIQVNGTAAGTYNGSAAVTLNLKNGNGISISNSSGAITFAHSNSIIAKTAYGSTATTASANGGSFTITDVKYDAQGHITGSTDRTITLSQTTYTLDSLGGVPTTRTINDKALSSDITLSASDVGAESAGVCLPLAGGTMTGLINNTTVDGGSWLYSRTKGALNVINIPTTDTCVPVITTQAAAGSWAMGTTYGSSNLIFAYSSDADYIAANYSGVKYIQFTSSGGVTGAVWNDYAEYRAAAEEVVPGQVVYSDNSGSLYKTTSRLQSFEGVVSDTFGFSIGETSEAKTPLAVAGRVLVYPDEDRYTFHAGDAVCAGKNGTVSKMTREEIINYPDRIVGIVSEIPEYKIWGSGDVEVNGRIWIKVK